MTQEEKELLLKDICCRIPYRVKVKTEDGKHPLPLTPFHLDFYEHDISNIKPYLLPLSSMTDEQEEEYNKLNCWELGCFPHTEEALDYLIKNHFDYRYLIDMGLAIDATNLNIY